MKIHINDIFLSDDSRDFTPHCGGVFVATDSNKRFKNLIKDCTIITPHELHKYLQNNCKIVGITGTNGKTTIASAMYSMLLSLGYKCALLGTRGFFVNDSQIAPRGLTTPSLLELYHDIHIASNLSCEYFIMEVSSHAIAQNRIDGLPFALRILSNITQDHLDFHHTLDEYIRVKNSFFENEDLKLINKDSPHVRFNVVNSYTYGIENASNLAPSAYSIKNGINAHIFWQDFYRKAKEQSMLQSHLFGKHSLYNALAGIAGVKLLLQDTLLERICEAFRDFGGVRGRMEVAHQNPLVIVDFAHTPDGMKNIFEAFLGNKIKVVFGAGGDRDKTKRPLMGKVAQHYANKIYLTSDNPRSENPESIIDEILNGISRKDKVVIEPSRAHAIELALKELREDEVLLILGKGDEDYQIIGENTLPFDDRLEVERFYTS